MKHHMTTYLVCLKQLCKEILEVLLIHTVYRACQRRPSILLRAFFYIGACVRAFIYSLPVLCIDGTFLTGKYKGTILTAIGIDYNKQIVLIAFAFVENENTESWYWFLERLKIHVVAGCCLLQMQVWGGPRLLYWGLEPAAPLPGSRGLHAIKQKF